MTEQTASTAPTTWQRLVSAGRRFTYGTGRVFGRIRRNPWSRRARVSAMVGLIGVGGVVIGTLLFGHATVNVGPFRAEMSISPSIFGGTEVDLPPLGSLHLDSHDGPVHLKVNLAALDQNRTEALIDDPAAISRAGENAVDDVRTGVIRLGVRTLGIAILSAMVLSALIFRNVRRVAAAGVTALVVTGGSFGLAASTLRPDSIAEPRYEGLLVNAPAVVGDARRIADNYGRYSEQLQQIVSNVSRLYTTVSSLPVYEPAEGTTRILHVSDLHLNPSSFGLIRTVVQTFDIDAVIDTGDLVDWGSTAETGYASSIPSVGVPYVWVRGNHDSASIQSAVGRQRNAIVLDNKIQTVAGLTIGGIGDPEFTPDKSETPAAQNDAEAAAQSPLLRAGTQLADTIRASDKPVDIALVHDPAMAPPLSGVVPLVLAGHKHQRSVELMQPPTPAPSASPSAAPSAGATVPEMSTRLMVEGSTGGAGLRGLEKEQPTPLSLSVLYFDEKHELKAYDDIQLGGTGQSNVEMQRNVIGALPSPSVSVSPSG
ncbi:metallophosphoesterase [Actinoplanes bogorensis]|uniref:Metallophosphoesterase n=1 Tax=Paractinoplanes bogorensis TaxID=1610840 RepID=A0ABS5YF12_9ACTN|nr:metallophosphoesterase [Actinoplanes bogorensis]MBU2662038.1 metallophosphoesterase [Actinoplanes bogorensis]